MSLCSAWSTGVKHGAGSPPKSTKRLSKTFRKQSRNFSLTAILSDFARARDARAARDASAGGTLYDDGDVMVLEPGDETMITHEEHGVFALPKTAEQFDVRKVQEFDHAAEAARNVAD